MSTDSDGTDGDVNAPSEATDSDADVDAGSDDPAIPPAFREYGTQHLPQSPAFGHGKEGIADLVDSLLGFAVREDRRLRAANRLCVFLQYVEVDIDVGGEIGFVDDQQVGLRDTGPALPWDVVALSDRDDEHEVVGQLGIKRRREVVAAGLDEDDIKLRMLLSELVDLIEVHRGVFADARMRTRAGFDAGDQFLVDPASERRLESLGVLLCHDVVGDDADVVAGIIEPRD